MGGGHTTRTVTTYASDFDDSSLLRSHTYGGYSKQAQDNVGRETGTKETDSKRDISTDSPNPIAIAIDVTGSMGDAAFLCWDKMPLLFGQLAMHYADEPEVSFCAVGDAVAGDSWPLQVCDFSAGDELDEELQKIYVEHGGGGGVQETYETAAYYYLNKSELTSGEKGILFLIGDEAPYPNIKPRILKSLFGKTSELEVTSKDVFKELREKYEVVLIQIPYYHKETAKEVNRRWSKYLPKSRILPLTHAKALIDVILGATAMLNEKRTRDEYLEDLLGLNGIREEGQTQDRIQEVRKALAPLSKEFNKDGTHKKKSKKKNGQVQKIKKAAGV